MSASQESIDLGYRTYFDGKTGAYLGVYAGPDDSNPFMGQPSVPGQDGDAYATLNLAKMVVSPGVPPPSPEAAKLAALLADNTTPQAVKDWASVI